MPDRSWPSLAGGEEWKGQTRVWRIQGQAGPSTVTLISYLSFSDCQQSFCFCFFLSVSLFPSNNHILYLGIMSLKYFLFVSAWLARPLGLQDVSPPTRDWTGRLALKAPNPHHWATREFLLSSVFNPEQHSSLFSPTHLCHWFVEETWAVLWDVQTKEFGWIFLHGVVWFFHYKVSY